MCLLENSTANIRRMPVRCPLFAIKGATADHDTQTCCLAPKLNKVLVLHYSMGSILCVYQTKELFIIFKPVADVTKYPSNKYNLNWVTKTPFVVDFFCFNFAKVRSEHY